MKTQRRGQTNKAESKQARTGKAQQHNKRAKSAAPTAAPAHCADCDAEEDVLQYGIEQYPSIDGKRVLCMRHFLKQFGKDFAEDFRKKLEAQYEFFGQALAEVREREKELPALLAAVTENEAQLKRMKEQQDADLQDIADQDRQTNRARWHLSEARSDIGRARAKRTKAENRTAELVEEALAARAKEARLLDLYRQRAGAPAQH